MLGVRDAAQEYVVRPVSTFLEPYLRLGYEGVSSTKTQKVALNVGIFGSLFGALLTIALTIYGLFYCIYIPQVTHAIPVYLQYGEPSASVRSFARKRAPHCAKYAILSSAPYRNLLLPGASTIQPCSTTHDLCRAPETSMHPHALVDFSANTFSRQSTYLTPEQHYNFALELSVPDSHSNFDLGNFMVYIDLQSKANKTLASSSRTGILQYRTPLLRTMLTIWKGLPLVFGWTKEAQSIFVPLVEKYEEMREHPTHHALVRLSDSKLQLYQATLHIDASFQGLRYFMYHWKLSTGSVFVAAIMFWETLAFFMVWRVLVACFKTRGPGDESAPTSSASSIAGGSQTPEDADKAQRGQEQSILNETLDARLIEQMDNDEGFSPPASVYPIANMALSPRSMSSAPSYHSGPFGSPPQYAMHATPPPSFDGRQSPFVKGSAYSYAFSRAGGTNGRLPYISYSTKMTGLSSSSIGGSVPDASTSSEPAPQILSTVAASPEGLTEEMISALPSTSVDGKEHPGLPHEDTQLTLESPPSPDMQSLGRGREGAVAVAPVGSQSGTMLRRRSTYHMLSDDEERNVSLHMEGILGDPPETVPPSGIVVEQTVVQEVAVELTPSPLNVPEPAADESSDTSITDFEAETASGITTPGSKADWCEVIPDPDEQHESDTEE
ncbi:putative adipose-regulatory protein-domain-containing protein [Fimicolochytrium jonesii]|uniref:putative adipose-regulatory protein-domain-containing protein n=1 Tax=Fimicolochytrium jonesii TaxID=1396493 RepID=UPI0022FE5CF4|nr:putative adipose-regulatory protein-domain-containing protein [Fimicolochytrium jonesii]KAI8824962.1 putative adipose-regulatory protein-domain-containing protein [Fimicolochytrium jonesii]